MTTESFQQDQYDDEAAVEEGRHIRASIARRVSAVASSVRAVASKLAARTPSMQDTATATRDGARATTTALQQLPDSTLRALAATSLGVGAGLYLAGKQRLLVVAGVVPAVMMSAAIILRPSKRREPAKSES